jgi:hypothetical protein
MAVAQFLGVRQRLRYIMNVLRWQRLFHRRRDNRPSPLASIVGRVRFVRGSWERDMQSRSHAAQQRTSRVADARKRLFTDHRSTRERVGQGPRSRGSLAYGLRWLWRLRPYCSLLRASCCQVPSRGGAGLRTESALPASKRLRGRCRFGQFRMARPPTTHRRIPTCSAPRGTCSSSRHVQAGAGTSLAKSATLPNARFPSTELNDDAGNSSYGRYESTKG